MIDWVGDDQTETDTEAESIAVRRKKPVSVEMVEEPDGRYVVSTYPDGEVVRQLVVKTKPKRKPIRPFKKLGMDRTRKKQF